jgi:hypothetical protein
MNTLFTSFLVALGAAVGLVSLSKAFDLDFYTARIFPLIPLIYAIVYEALEKRRTGRTRHIPPSDAREEMKAGAATLFQNITVGRIAGDVGINFLIKFSLEIVLTAVFLAVGHQTFSDLYGSFGIETVGRFMKGEHPWVGGGQGMILLALIAVISSLGTGLWIGNTGKGNAILEGVIAGAMVTVITSMTNMLILYREIEALADQAARFMGYALHVGFLVVLLLKVLLYGLWSGMAQRAKLEREAVRRLSSRKSRR